MITFLDRANAFAIQAQADLDARDSLARCDLPECQQLHFLQMACEKLCKAHLFARQCDPKLIEASHAYIARNLPLIIRQWLAADATVARKDRAILARSIDRFSRD